MKDKVCVFCLLWLVAPTAAAQAPWGLPEPTIAQRDYVARRSGGEHAKAFMRDYPTSYYALSALNISQANELVDFYKKNQLACTALPEKLLLAIAQSGDSGARFVMNNAELFTDPAYTEAFLADCHEIAAGYKDIHKQVIKLRAYRWYTDWRYGVGGFAGLTLLYLALKRRRRMMP